MARSSKPLISLFTGLLIACAAPTADAAEPPLPAPAQWASSCFWHFFQTPTAWETRSPLNLMTMSNDGWCRAHPTYLYNGQQIAALGTVLHPPQHGTVVLQYDGTGRIYVAYRPTPGFVGTDFYDLDLALGGALKNLAMRVEALVGQPMKLSNGATSMMVKSEPLPSALPTGWKILVDDGSCPAGQIKLDIAGNNRLKIPRTHTCIPDPPTP
jgi:hypothetical protein